MARIGRFVVPDLPHHARERGNRREKVLFGDDDALYRDFFAEREGNLKSSMREAHRLRRRPHSGVVLEFKFPSRIIASKQSMTDRRRARRAARGETKKGEICMCPRKAQWRSG